MANAGTTRTTCHRQPTPEMFKPVLAAQWDALLTAAASDVASTARRHGVACPGNSLLNPQPSPVCVRVSLRCRPTTWRSSFLNACLHVWRCRRIVLTCMHLFVLDFIPGMPVNCQAFQSARVPTTLEPTDLFHDDGRRPDGVTVGVWKVTRLGLYVHVY